MHTPTPPIMPPAAQPDRKAATVILVIETVVYALSLLPWLLMLMFAPMAYDSPGSTTLANIFVTGILGWPVVIVIALVMGWWKRTVKRALLAGVAPIAWVVLILIVMKVMNPT